jgi:hypothetical protein
MDRKLFSSRTEPFDNPVAAPGLVLTLLFLMTLLSLAAPARAAPEGAAPEGAGAPEGAAPLVLALAPPEQPGTGDPDLNFDIPATLPPQQEISGHGSGLSLRRGMLVGHQALGFGLLATDLAATIVGQLNYNDHFVSGAPTGRYQSAHRTLAWATVGTFVAAGALAVFAPSPPHRVSQGFDRMTLHKLCMASATAAMVAQAALGMATAGREGRLDQEGLGKAHLAIGYFTFAALAIGFGALVF